MNRAFTLLGATAAGFAGVMILHGPSSSTSTLPKASSPVASHAKAATSSKGSGATPTTTPPAPVNGTAVGKSENYGYGQLSVKVTTANNRIVDVAVSSIQALDAYSMQLEQQVAPMLRSEVLKAQGTRISGISGATYTSEAYDYSLQSALDQLHFP